MTKHNRNDRCEQISVVPAQDRAIGGVENTPNQALIEDSSFPGDLRSASRFIARYLGYQVMSQVFERR